MQELPLIEYDADADDGVGTRRAVVERATTAAQAAEMRGHATT